jgi:hypothetical protein
LFTLRYGKFDSYSRWIKSTIIQKYKAQTWMAEI